MTETDENKPGEGVVTVERKKVKFKRPKKWKLIFHNDDFTPFTFVVELLTTIYRKTFDEAKILANEIHRKGQGVVYVSTYEIIETKYILTRAAIDGTEHPLMISMEEEG